jgi:hypothetical protein
MMQTGIESLEDFRRHHNICSYKVRIVGKVDGVCARSVEVKVFGEEFTILEVARRDATGEGEERDVVESAVLADRTAGWRNSAAVGHLNVRT